MIVDTRVTIYDPTAQNVQILDASGELAGLTYEDTPSGCGAGKLSHELFQEQVVARGYYRGLNVVEISTGDDVLRYNVAPGIGYVAVIGPASGWTLGQSSPIAVSPNSTATISFSVSNSTQQVAGAVQVHDASSGALLYAFNISPSSGQSISQTFATSSGSVYLTIGANGASMGAGQVVVLSPTISSSAGTSVAISGTSSLFPPSGIQQGTAQSLPIVIGTSKLYVNTTAAWDPTQGEDAQQAYLWDGSQLTMRIPVTIAADTGGPYLVTSAPLAGGGNPTSIPFYVTGTVVGRRRYVGRIVKRSITNSRTPGGDVTLVGMAQALAQVTDTVTISVGAKVDAGTALATVLAKNASRWPFFKISASNFPTVGAIYSGSFTDSQVDQIVSDILTKIPTGDQWALRIGHDLTPKLQRLYTSNSNTYAYSVTLSQGVSQYEAQSVSIDDQDVSGLFNSVKVIGDTDPGTKQPIDVIAQDPTSIAYYGLQIDGAPVTQTGAKDATTAANFGLGLLNGASLARSNDKLTVYTRNDYPAPVYPGNPFGVQDGDVIRGNACVTVNGFDESRTSLNFAPDSEIQYGTGVGALWTQNGGGLIVATGPSGNGFQLASSSSSSVNSAAGPSIAVVPGQTYTFTGAIGASGVTSGAPRWTINVFGAGIIAQVVGTAGQTTTPAPVSFTIPPGTYAIQVVADANRCTGSNIIWQHPMLSLGSATPAYVPNYAAPNVYGLVSSVVSTVDLKKQDRWQDASFSAVEPDWNAAISEKANAALTAAQANRATPLAIDQYVVSAGAFDGMVAPNITGWSTSSLAVTTPVFAALFARGSGNVPVGGGSPSFTLAPMATTWAWLNPGGTWTLQPSTATVPGGILYGIFTTSSSGVLGFTPKAPIGVIQVGYGNVNSATSLPAPTIATNGWTFGNGSSLNGLSADVQAVVSVTNVPTDGSVGGLLWLFRASAQTPVAPWVPYGETNLATGSAQQTSYFDYGALDNGATYDFAVAYVGLAGYGPLTTTPYIGWVAKTIGIPTSYQLGGTTITPNVLNPSVITAASANGLNAAVTIAFQVANQPTDGSLSRIQLWVRPSGVGGSSTIGAGGFAWSPYSGQPAVGVGTVPGPTTAGYGVTIADLTAGQSYDFGVSYENTQGGESTIATIVSGFMTTLSLPTSAFTPMPASFAVNGPSLSGASVMTSSNAAGSPVGTITFNENDWSANQQPGWFSGYYLYTRVIGDSSSTMLAGQIGATSAVQGITGQFVAPAGGKYDVGVAFIASKGNVSAINWIVSGVGARYIQPIAILGSGVVNLLKDSNLDFGTSYWTPTPAFDATHLIATGGTSNTAGVENALVITTGASTSVNQNFVSQPVAVQPGSTYTYSAYVDCSNSAGGPAITMLDQNGNTLAQAAQVRGVASVISCTATIPSGVTTVTARFVSTGVVPTQGTLTFAMPQIELGSQASAYRPGAAVASAGRASTFGIAHTAQSTATQATIAPIAGSEGSFLNSDQIAPRHMQTFGSTTFLRGTLSLTGYSDTVPTLSATTSSGGSSTITVTWPTFNIRLTDGSTIQINSGSATITGYSASTTYYVYAWFSKSANTQYQYATVSSGYLMFYAGTALQSGAFIQAINTDGSVSVMLGSSVTTPAAPASGTSAPSSGSGGKTPQCPASFQEVETRERGYVFADTLRVGEHLRDPVDGWNRISLVEPQRDELLEITVRGEPVSVDCAHLWLRAGGDPDARSSDWLKSYELTMNTMLQPAGGGAPVAIEGIRRLGSGWYVRIICERNRFTLGRLVAHNIATS